MIEKFYKHLEQCIVPRDKWSDRDSNSAQRNIGDIWRLLKSGHRFEIWSDYKDEARARLLSLDDFFSPENTICTNYIYIYDIMTFSACEYDTKGEKITYYFPTPFGLKNAEGKDWY